MKDEDKSRDELISELKMLRNKYKALYQSFLAVKPDLGGTETILVVDDNDDTREVVVRMLETMGYTLLQAESGQKALELIQSRGRKVHLVLTDVVMPDISGPQMAEQMAQLQPGIRILFMSGYAEDEIVHNDVFGILSADKAFVRKPFSIEEICQVIRAQLDQYGDEKSQVEI